MDALYDSILQKFHAVFTPTAEEERIFTARLKQYTPEELMHLDANFALFGVSEVLSCVFEFCPVKREYK